MKTPTLVFCLLSALQISEVRAQDTLQHPVLSISSNNGSAANSILSTYSESQYTNDFTPRYAPRNEGYGFASAVVSGDTGWSWSKSNPTNLTSTPSGTVFPNASYSTVTTNLPVLNGDVFSQSYYHPLGSSSGRSLVFNVISYHQQSQRDSDLDNLAGAYIGSGSSSATRNDNYARRIAVELMDWGRWYPDYIMNTVNSSTFVSAGTNYFLTSGGVERASDHNGLAHEWNDSPIKAFDAIYDSVALTNLSTEMGFDVRGYITTNIFFFEGDFLAYHVALSYAIAQNIPFQYQVMPLVAEVLNRPDYMVFIDQFLSASVTTNLNRDGVLGQGIGYSYNYLGDNIGVAQNALNYFHVRPATNGQFVAISNRISSELALFHTGQAQWATVSWPDGELPSFGDTDFNVFATGSNNGRSGLLGSYGHVSMGNGTSPNNAVQVNQQFAGNANHMRSDVTAFTFWAFGNPYLENIHYYNGAIGRNFGEQMLSHNTVEINRSDLTPFPGNGSYGNANLTLYEPGNNSLAVTELDGYRDYSSYASRFQRIMLLNSVDLARPYVVDIYRVTGGTNHDYCLHGAIRWNQNWQCSFPLVTNSNPYPMLEGTEAWDPTTDTPYYGFWRNVSSNAAPGNFQITYTDTNRAAARDTRLWMTADPGMYDVYVGTTPVPSRDNNAVTNFFNHLGITRPSAVIRHRISSGSLSDLYVSVIEPMNGGASNIVSVQRLSMSGVANESCGLQVTFTDGRVDTYIVNLRNPKIVGAGGGSATVSTADGQYSLNGRVALAVDRSNGDSRVWTVNATDFKYLGREFTTPDTYYSGLIAGATRRFDGAAYDAFTMTAPLPTGTALRGKYLSLTHGKLSSGTTNISEMFKIDQVVFTNGLYNICFTNDHFLEITNGITSVEQCAPLRTFTTSNSFEIALTAFARQISPIADQMIPPGGSSGAVNFTFGNLGTSSGASLQVLATSSNQAVVPNSNLAVGGSGTNRTITVTAPVGQTGSSLITVCVTDGIWTNSRTFNATIADFVLTTSPSSQSVLAGNSVNYTNVVFATNGTGTVEFGISGLPAGASANFNPLTTTGSGTNVLTVTTASDTPAGSYPLTITATAGALSSTNVVTLVVNVINPTPGWSTWTGSSSIGSDWSDSANWSSAPAPGNSLAFGLARFNNTNDTAGGTTYSNLVFNSGADSFTLNGNSFTLVTGVTNNSSVQQTVGLGINFANNIVFSGANGPLVINGGLTNTSIAAGATSLMLAGTGVLVNQFKSTPSPGGTNLIAMNSASANWTLIDNPGSAQITVPWTFAITNGTFNFGDTVNAPNLTTTTVNGAPMDNQLGMVSGGTGTFNMVRGTLTTSARFNTATAANSTGIINQSAGTMNIGSQFQGANGSNAGEVSVINASGGTMNISGGSGPFYVASRGTGTLTLSGAGMVNCGRLDISRNAAGNTISSVGTVNLNGGTLSVTSVTNASANQQTGGSPTAIFNFNGGTLLAKSGAAPIFFQGSTATPIMPIQTFIKAGGAVINDGGNNITIAEPLGHDSSLGSNPDGGLLKLGGGTLTLTGTNSYTGDTSVSAGALALSGGGSITNSGNISIAAEATLDASGRTDAKLTVVSGQTLSGNGTLAGNVIVNGTISPGADSVGGLTNKNGSIIFGAGGTYAFDMSDAVGQQGSNWDLFAASGVLDIQASSTNPFAIQVRSIDMNPSDNNAGAADFGNASAQSWVIASGSGFTNFASNKFAVDDSQFQNDLAGGYFLVQTNGNSLALAFIPNNPPMAADAFFYLPPTRILQIPISALSASWSDPDGDPATLSNVNPSSVSGNSVSTDGSFIYYTNANNSADEIVYTIADVRTNPPATYRVGDTRQFGTGVVHVLPPPAIGSVGLINGSNLTFSGGGGISTAPYVVLMSTNLGLGLDQWLAIATNRFDSNGNFAFTNSLNPNASQMFYLLKVQ